MNGGMVQPTVESSRAPGSSLSGLTALFGLCLSQFARGRRLIILSGLFALPAILACVIRLREPGVHPDEIAFGLIFQFIPQTLLPIVALVFSCGMLQDEIEEQTLTYLLVRPLPRWAIYLCKLLAAWLVTIAIAAVFVSATYLVIYAGRPGWTSAVMSRLPQTIFLVALSSAAYCSIFGFLSLLVKRSIVTGIVYVVLMEGFLANIDFALRRLTVMYYFRVLALRMIPLDTQDKMDWEINLPDAPSNAECIAILLGACVVVTVLAVRVFSTKEFRVKTPEGS